MNRLRLRDRFLRWLEAGRVHRPVRWQDWPVMSYNAGDEPEPGDVSGTRG